MRLSFPTTYCLDLLTILCYTILYITASGLLKKWYPEPNMFSFLCVYVCVTILSIIHYFVLGSYYMHRLLSFLFPERISNIEFIFIVLI